ncbi:hypothetical protein PACTADRAFT_47001 [Pachysolen tannophilus NRRL Y-2460]|uniref:Major facilitator superfamily (MFS) profile domain-containing protein n=1 Tax=Pachysolen tannophilus NRRL Y-2460 TaxID=669874 RepID=A0A1E4TN78_PACTA|nr:hypothetical protein PACTADRAFT_47001 [Pachysolen tannophilus NRRL Y-2460]
MSPEDLKNFQIDPEEEAKLTRKLDRYLIPMFAVMYFLSSLDRSNIGNAYTSGMKEDLALTATQYSTAVSVFYSTYLVSELPATLFMKKLKPHYYLSFLVFSWSMVCLFSGFVKSYGSLIATRVLLGTFEGGFFPAIVTYTTMTWKSEEQAKRISYFFGSASLSGAFGGLIATGLTKVTSSTFEGWRWLYVIEGIISVFASLWLFFGLPDSPADLKFLSPREKMLMKVRAKQRELYLGDLDHINWQEVKSAVFDIRTHISYCIQFCQDTILYGFSTFLPSILKSGLGYDSMQAQYLSVPVYLLAGLVFLISAWISDRYKVRGIVFFCYNFVGVAGFIILLACDNDAVKYFACYLITFSLYTGTGLNIAWTTNNFSGFRRNTAIGLNQTFGNLSGAIVGQVYRSSPYVLGNSFSLGCICVSMILTVSQLFYLRHLNREKEAILRGEKVDTKKDRLGDRALEFKYCY